LSKGEGRVRNGFAFYFFSSKYHIKFAPTFTLWGS
jgi:hypothetical protein